MSKLGFSGSVARRFQSTQITPLLALVGLLLGVFAVLVTPREEEPQINVTFANVFIPFPGASASEIEHLLASPAEQVLSEIEGVKHELSTVPGVLEDVTDIVLNLKQVVFALSDVPSGWATRNRARRLPKVRPPRPSPTAM